MTITCSRQTNAKSVKVQYDGVNIPIFDNRNKQHKYFRWLQLRKPKQKPNSFSLEQALYKTEIMFLCGMISMYSNHKYEYMQNQAESIEWCYQLYRYYMFQVLDYR